MTVPRILVPCAMVLAFGCAVTEANKPAAMKAAERPTVPADIEAPTSAALVVQLAARGTQRVRGSSATLRKLSSLAFRRMLPNDTE